MFLAGILTLAALIGCFSAAKFLDLIWTVYRLTSEIRVFQID